MRKGGGSGGGTPFTIHTTHVCDIVSVQAADRVGTSIMPPVPSPSPSPLSASSLPSPPVPITTDASLIKAIATIVKYIERVATGFVPRGEALEVVQIYEELTHASKPQHLAMICEKLSIYCHKEACLHSLSSPSSSRSSPSASPSAGSSSSSSLCDTLRGFEEGFQKMSDKFIDAGRAHMESQIKKATTEGQRSQIKFMLAYEYAHAEAERGMMNLYGGRMAASAKLFTAARTLWETCIEQVPIVYNRKTLAAAPTPNLAANTLSKLVDDILTLHYCAQLLSRTDESYWSELATSLLTRELDLLCTSLPADIPLHRLRLSRLLQTSTGTPEERGAWFQELCALPQPPAKMTTTESALNHFGELMGIVEELFVTEQTPSASSLNSTSNPSPDEPQPRVTSLANSKKRACAAILHHQQSLLKKVSSTTPMSCEDERALQQQCEIEQRRILGTFEFASAVIEQSKDYKQCYQHCRHALAHFTQVSAATSAPSSLSTHSSLSVSPLQRFFTIVIRLRLYYLWSVQAELRGAHAEAKYICTKAIEEAEAQFYSTLHPSLPTVTPSSSSSCTAASSHPSSSTTPYSAIVAGHLLLARIQFKLDLIPQTGEILQQCGLMGSANTRTPPCKDLLTSETFHRMAPFVGANGVHLAQVHHWLRQIVDNRHQSNSSKGGDANNNSKKEDEEQKSHAADADDLVDQLTQQLAHIDLQSDAPCETCQLFNFNINPPKPSKKSLAASPPSQPSLTPLHRPCTIDALLFAQLADPITRPKLSKKGGGLTAAAKKKVLSDISELESLLDQQLAHVRHPGLVRVLHQKLAVLHASLVTSHDTDENTVAGVRPTFHAHQAIGVTAITEWEMLREKHEDAAEEKTNKSKAIVSSPNETDLQSFYDTFLPQLPADWTLLTLDRDTYTGDLLASVLTFHTAYFQTIPLGDTKFNEIDTQFRQALKQADEASKLAGQYNADRSMKKATSTGSAKSSATKESSATQSKQLKAQIESMRVSTNTTIAATCGALEQLLEPCLDALKAASESDGPIILLTSSSLAHLPWENMSTVSQREVYRMVHWRLIQDRLKNMALASTPTTSKRPSSTSALETMLPMPLSRGYYVLNPQGNIRASEEFESVFFELGRGWNGTVGSAAVDRMAWLAALRQSQYFVYVGHNGGEEIVNPRDILKTLKRSTTSGTSANDVATGPLSSSVCGVHSVALQMGCSSALQRYKEAGPRPFYEADGLSLIYQQTGCPAMFGCLWNVPEDIDRWLQECVKLLKTSQLSQTSPRHSLMRSAIQARSACKQSHLTGAAVVCYGLPVNVRSS